MEFQHKLPSMSCEDENGVRIQNGNYNNPEISFPCMLTTEDSKMGMFIKGLRDIILSNRRMILVDGQTLVCNHNWIRDQNFIMEGFKHWEYDLHSYLDFIINHQHEKGFYYELIKQMDDAHWSFVDEECYVKFPEDNVAMTRLELEADVEYDLILSVEKVYKVEGDLDYVAKVLPSMEKAIDYMTSDVKRWDPEHGLVKRPFTIDTWDFTNDESSQWDRRIYFDNMSIMHGDNSGVYAAMKVLSFFNRKLGNEEKAQQWDSRAETLKQNMITYLWNGNFFIHQLHLNHPGVDNLENQRLSLSNGYDINRGVTTMEQSRKIIEEYMRRRETTDTFAEWFTVDPPYAPAFMRYQPGQYVNGAICPFAAGALALAAFNNGYEEYGYDILCRLQQIFEETGKIRFLYDRKDIHKGEDTSGPSAWGAGDILKAIDEGFAGLTDPEEQYRVLGFSPKFPVSNHRQIRYITGYEKCGVTIDVSYQRSDEGLLYQVTAPSTEIRAHILLPKHCGVSSVLVNGQHQAITYRDVYGSPYVDFVYRKSPNQHLKIEIYLQSETTSAEL